MLMRRGVVAYNRKERDGYPETALSNSSVF
jgi:hypothetical protein